MTVNKSIWKQRLPDTPETQEMAAELAEVCDIPQAVARTAMARGYNTPEDVMAYLEPSEDDFHDPWQLPDMQTAVERILQAKEKQETICIYGDYDVDGTTAVSMLMKYFKSIGINCFFKIPNRLTEGYGMNLPAVDTVIGKGAKLIITVDNGIASKDEVAHANERGTDVIVTDHHECQDDLPPALAVIDAKRPDSAYPFRELCGAGIAFKLIQALETAQNRTTDLREYLECAAMATVADIVPLKDENRLIVKLGLSSMNGDCVNPGIRALKIVSEVDEVTAGRIGFILAPKINAAGRLGEANRVVDLYTGDDAVKITATASFLKDENTKRQQIEQDILQAALKQIQDERRDKNVFIIAEGKNWHSGVIGIVASKIQEKWYHPVIVMGIDDDGLARGSCRSVDGINIFKALSSCANLFETYGGHEMAAGFSIREEKIPELKERLEAWAEENDAKAHLVQTVLYDGELTTRELTWALIDGLAMCEPYGVANPGPLFRFNVMTAADVRTMGKDSAHLSFRLGGTRCIAFGKGQLAKKLSKVPFDFLASPKVNHFRGQDSIELSVQDIKVLPLYDNTACFVALRDIARSQGFDDVSSSFVWEYDEETLMPTRDDYVVVYKTLKHHQNGLSFDALVAEMPDGNSFKGLMVLEVLKEIGVIHYCLKKGIVFSKISVSQQKKNIQKSPLVVKLRKYLLKTRG